MNPFLNTAVLANNPFIGALLAITLLSVGFTYYKSKDQNEKLDLLVAEVAALRNVIEERFSEELRLVEDSPVEESPVEESPVEESPVEESQPHEPNTKTHNDEKHALLLSKVEEGTEVHITYKKETSTAIFNVNSDAPNGYILRHQNEDYNTPSHFSTYIKKQKNPTIQADNGWDSLYVITGTKENGKPIKCTLNALIHGSDV